MDIHAKVTIFCDGVRGNLTKQLYRRLAIGAGREPEQFAIGLKELWEVPQGRIETGTVMHTLGHPLRHEEFGGGFIYARPADGRAARIGLDYHDPLFDPRHSTASAPSVAGAPARRRPLVLRRQGAARRVEHGAANFSTALIAGDAAGFVNSVRLKGIHLAMRTGMLAAETAFRVDRRGRHERGGAGCVSDSHRRQRRPPRSSRSGVRRRSVTACCRGLLYAGAAMLTRGDAVPRPAERTLRWCTRYRMASPGGPGGAARSLAHVRQADPHALLGTAHDEDQPVHQRVRTGVCSSIC